MNRSQQIIRTSIIGIAANVLLAAFKAAVGILASSVAIIMDAVNNLSDALSSVITIIGTKLSQRPADREHPFGFGRIEYFSAIIIAVIVLSAGITSLIESVKKIFDPTVLFAYILILTSVPLCCKDTTFSKIAIYKTRKCYKIEKISASSPSSSSETPLYKGQKA